ncbi:hypothetical protein N824_05140 [Pedobacter sp. V48]|nr:hypothetical protein N824_05140 [Pedobacter sp. V48]
MSCKKSDDKIVFSGTYTGKFIEGPVNQLVSVNTEVKFSGDGYAATNGTGIFTVENSSKIKFSMDYVASMDYVGNKVLQGDYSYVTKGDSLILDKIFPSTEHHYTLTSTISYKNQYRLKRMK